MQLRNKHILNQSCTKACTSFANALMFCDCAVAVCLTPQAMREHSDTRREGQVLVLVGVVDGGFDVDDDGFLP